MARSSRIDLFALAGFVGLLVLVAAALLFLVDANVYKSRFETAVANALGMEVRIGGRLRIAFFPGLRITLEDLHLRNRGAEVASAQEAGVQIALLPLLRNELRIDKVALKHARISIEKDRDGQFNIDRPDTVRTAQPGRDWPDVALSETTFVYADKRSSEGFEAVDCRVDMRGARLAGGEPSKLVQDLSFNVELTCGQVRSDRFTATDLKFSAMAKDGVLDLQPVEARLFGAQGSGTIRADFSGALPAYHVRYELPQFAVEEFFKAMSQQKVAAGRMDFSANLSLQGRTVKEMRQTLTGQISLRGKNLTLHGSDLDGQISRYASSQNFNLFDVGAVVLAGPLGLVATRGYNFATVFQAGGGSSDVQTLVSDWKVERGVALAQDVAIATKENRVALQGGLDFVNEQFDDVTMAVIDAKGCAKVRQKIRGTFKNPVVEKPGLLESLTGPALSLLKKGADLLGADCEVFYAGSVTAPN